MSFFSPPLASVREISLFEPLRKYVVVLPRQTSPASAQFCWHSVDTDWFVTSAKVLLYSRVPSGFLVQFFNIHSQPVVHHATLHKWGLPEARQGEVGGRCGRGGEVCVCVEATIVRMVSGKIKEKMRNVECASLPGLRRRLCNCSVPGYYSMPMLRPSWLVPSAQACHLSDSTQFSTCCLGHELAERAKSEKYHFRWIFQVYTSNAYQSTV